jgi:hypothetical protein
MQDKASLCILITNALRQILQSIDRMCTKIGEGTGGAHTHDARVPHALTELEGRLNTTSRPVLWSV